MYPVIPEINSIQLINLIGSYFSMTFSNDKLELYLHVFSNCMRYGRRKLHEIDSTPNSALHSAEYGLFYRCNR